MTESVTQAYLAGMIDADGSIYAYIQRKSGTLDLKVMVYNANEDLMDWLVLHFGGNKRLYKRNDRNPTWLPLYCWTIYGGPACALLKEIEQFMVVKQVRARLAIEALERKGDYKGKAVPPKELELRQEFVEQMHILNRVGKN